LALRETAGGLEVFLPVIHHGSCPDDTQPVTMGHDRYETNSSLDQTQAIEKYVIYLSKYKDKEGQIICQYGQHMDEYGQNQVQVRIKITLTYSLPPTRDAGLL
jgi:hypothetical protein